MTKRWLVAHLQQEQGQGQDEEARVVGRTRKKGEWYLSFWEERQQHSTKVVHCTVTRD
jgi:hypothetical protein